jgi:hypothetical protein
MEPLLGLGLLLLVLIAMYFFVRGWDTMRAQFGARLQDLFGRGQPPRGAAKPGKAKHWTAPLPPSQGNAKPPRAAPVRNAPPSRHAPTARHH